MRAPILYITSPIVSVVDIIESIKSLQSTVTVALEAAHILATLKLNPPVGHEGRTVLFPSM